MENNGSTLEDRSEDSHEGSVNTNDKDNEQVQQKCFKKYTINNKTRVATINYYGHILRCAHDGRKMEGRRTHGEPAFVWIISTSLAVDRNG